jgi:hypothetical protein
MPLRQVIVVTGLSLGVIVWVLDLLRRRRLKEEYAFLWLAGGALGLVCAWWYDGLVWLSRQMGIAIPTSTVFFLSLLVLALICLSFAVKISQLSEKVQRLAQELALREEQDGEAAHSRGSASSKARSPAVRPPARRR